VAWRAVGVTGDEPDGEGDEEGGAQERREDLAMRQPLRHEPRQLQLRRRVRVAMRARHSHARLAPKPWRPQARSATVGVGEDGDGNVMADETRIVACGGRSFVAVTMGRGGSDEDRMSAQR